MQVTLSQFKGFEGTVVIKPLANTERYELLAELSIEITGDKSLDRSIREAFGDFKKIAQLMRYCSKKIVSIDLKKDGVEYKTWQELDDDPSCQTAMLKIMMSCLGLNDKKKQKNSNKKPDGSTTASLN